MRYLIIILALVLIPTVALAEKAAKYGVACEDITGGQCKKECSEGEKVIKKIEIGEGEQKGIVAEVDCINSGKGLVCCVEKRKIKE